MTNRKDIDLAKLLAASPKVKRAPPTMTVVLQLVDDTKIPESGPKQRKHVAF